MEKQHIEMTDKELCIICENVLIRECSISDRIHKNGYWYKDVGFCGDCNDKIEKIFNDRDHRSDDNQLSWFELILMVGLGTNGCGKEKNKNKTFNGKDVEWQFKERFKTVDIAIHSAKLYVEVDGDHHYHDSEQVWSDLWRSFYSSLPTKNFLTLHIPNHLIKNRDSFHRIVDAIKGIAHERAKLFIKNKSDNTTGS